MADLRMSCSCATVKGVVRDISPKTTTRLVCMCEDCQAFAHLLERLDVLDDYGGSDVAVTSPSRVEFDPSAAQHIRCVRLQEKGQFRFYASCCNTPLGNALGPKIPFASVFSNLFEDPDDLGPIRAKVNGRSSTRNGPPEDGHARAPVGILFRSAAQVGRAALRREHRPSPLFDEGNPRFETVVLEPDARERLRVAVAAAKKS